MRGRMLAGFLLALAVLVQAAIGTILACHVHDRDVHVVAVAQTAILDEAVVASPDPTLGVGQWPGPPVCTSDRPCQHGTGTDRGADPAVLTAAASRADAAAVLVACPDTRPAATPVLPQAVSGPVLPAFVLRPVAVLCLDRN